MGIVAAGCKSVVDSSFYDDLGIADFVVEGFVENQVGIGLVLMVLIGNHHPGKLVSSREDVAEDMVWWQLAVLVGKHGRCDAGLSVPGLSRCIAGRWEGG